MLSQILTGCYFLTSFYSSQHMLTNNKVQRSQFARVTKPTSRPNEMPRTTNTTRAPGKPNRPIYLSAIRVSADLSGQFRIRLFLLLIWGLISSSPRRAPRGCPQVKIPACFRESEANIRRISTWTSICGLLDCATLRLLLEGASLLCPKNWDLRLLFCPLSFSPFIA